MTHSNYREIHPRKGKENDLIINFKFHSQHLRLEALNLFICTSWASLVEQEEVLFFFNTVISKFCCSDSNMFTTVLMFMNLRYNYSQSAQVFTTVCTLFFFLFVSFFWRVNTPDAQDSRDHRGCQGWNQGG